MMSPDLINISILSKEQRKEYLDNKIEYDKIIELICNYYGIYFLTDNLVLEIFIKATIIIKFLKTIKNMAINKNKKNISKDIINNLKSTIDYEKFNDPVNYTDNETGRNYIIYKKKSDKKKIIAEGIFRMYKRNERLPEYLSGILCTVNNLKEIFGDEWGYRLYIDDNFLRKNIVVKNTNNLSKVGSNYAYQNEFPEDDKSEWKKLFEDIK